MVREEQSYYSDLLDIYNLSTRKQGFIFWKAEEKGTTTDYLLAKKSIRKATTLTFDYITPYDTQLAIFYSVAAEKLISLKVNNVSFCYLLTAGDTGSNIEITQARGGQLFFAGRLNNDVQLTNDTLNYLTLDSLHNIRLRADHCLIGHLELLTGFFDAKSFLSFSQLPDTLSIYHVDCRNEASLDLFHVPTGKECMLYVSPQVSLNVGFDYSNFQVYWPSWFDSFYHDRLKFEKIRVYEQILEIQRKKGFTNGLQKVDIEYRSFLLTADGSTFGQVKDFLLRWWSNYGYEKERIFRNSISLFLLFFLSNLLFYKCFRSVYLPPKFTEWEQRLPILLGSGSIERLYYHLYRATGIFLYTAYIFWGLRLDFKIVEIRQPFSLFWIVLQHVVGLICMAYIANYILTE